MFFFVFSKNLNVKCYALLSFPEHETNSHYLCNILKDELRKHVVPLHFKNDNNKKHD